MFLTIKQLLLANSAVTALVGNRVFPDQVPEKKSLPAISMFQVSGQPKDLVDGTVLPRESQWQINCVATTRMTASQLADEVEKALHGKSADRLKKLLVTNRQNDLPAPGVKVRSTILDVSLKHY